MIKYSFVFTILLLAISSCKESNTSDSTPKKAPIASNLQVDHFNIWVTNPEKAKQKLVDIGFTAVPDSMSATHHGQGTSGRYINFLNSYLELIFVYDQKELEVNNKINKELDFTARALSHENGASPFSLALKMEEYNKDSIPFETIKYHQEWMEGEDAIYSARNSKLNLQEPSIFVVFPEMQANNFESTADLLATPSDDDSWKALFQHANGAEKITQITIHSKEFNGQSNSIHALNQIEGLSVKEGPAHLMEITLDNKRQGKTHDLRPELPLIVHL